ncbi:MAG: hypothetical protein HY973_01025 [Candidatus Kerfeldbacteria bacterium]|nr:hypothetical protein [Candidatus Kerfeldbacteria bacterium]
MNNLHTNSPCCIALIRRYGPRRRQCAKCLHTWRIRHKTLGRKRRRVSVNLARQYLSRELPSLKALARRRGCNRSTLGYILRASLKDFDRRVGWQDAPAQGYLVAVADACVVQVDKKPCTIYLILLKGINDTRAVISAPYFALGYENEADWLAAFGKLSPAIKQRIRALICDGAQSLRGVAIEHHWLIQRCHFHLVLSLGSYLSQGKKSRHPVYARLVFTALYQVLKAYPWVKAARGLYYLNYLAGFTKSRGFHKVINGFLTYAREYRTYREYPELHLPTTTNTAESLVGCIKRLLTQTRGMRTKRSLDLWLNCLLKHLGTITCHGYDQKKNQPN